MGLPGRTVLLAISLVTVVAAAGLPAQDAPFRATSDLVSVYATVTRAGGQYVGELKAGDFRVFDNGQPRPIDIFSNDTQPITAALIVDESGSMLRQLARVDAAAEAFVGRLGPRDRTSFSTLSHVGIGLTSDKTRLVAGIRAAANWPWWDNGSPIWSALSRGMTSLAIESGRRVLVIITDGGDEPYRYNVEQSRVANLLQPVVVPPATGDEVARRAAREGFMLYAIGFDGSPFEPGAKTIVQQSGGTFESIGAADDLTAAFTAIVDDLHRQYLIGFAPDSLDGTTHTIEVRCLQSGTAVRARESYLAEPAARRN